MLHQHPQELWGSITSSCFSAFHFFLRSEGREDQRSVPISPKNLSQIHKFVLPFTSISHGTWWLNTHCCGYRCHSSIARCCTQTNPFAAGISFLKWYKIRKHPTFSVSVKEAGSPPHSAYLCGGQCSAQAGRCTPGASSVAGQEQQVATPSHFSACFSFFSPQKEESLLDKDFALGNSGFWMAKRKIDLSGVRKGTIWKKKRPFQTLYKEIEFCFFIINRVHSGDLIQRIRCISDQVTLRWLAMVLSSEKFILLLPYRLSLSARLKIRVSSLINF